MTIIRVESRYFVINFLCSEYMGVSMSEANVLLDFLYPLIAEHDDELERFLVR